METEKKSNGALVGIVIVIIILVIGGIYMWMSNKTVNDPNIQTEFLSTTDSAAGSAELDTLEQEINVTDTDVGASVIDSVQ